MFRDSEGGAKAMSAPRSPMKTVAALHSVQEQVRARVPIPFPNKRVKIHPSRGLRQSPPLASIESLRL